MGGTVYQVSAVAVMISHVVKLYRSQSRDTIVYESIGIREFAENSLKRSE